MCSAPSAPCSERRCPPPGDNQVPLSELGSVPETGGTGRGWEGLRGAPGFRSLGAGSPSPASVRLQRGFAEVFRGFSRRCWLLVPRRAGERKAAAAGQPRSFPGLPARTSQPAGQLCRGNRNGNHLFKHAKVPKSLRAIAEGFFPFPEWEGSQGITGRNVCSGCCKHRKSSPCLFVFPISFSIPRGEFLGI